MTITTRITMDLQKKGIMPYIDAVQNESCTRAVALTLLSGGESWAIPAGASCAVRFRKADGTGGIYDTLPDGTAACAVSANTLTLTLAPQVLTCPGRTVVQAEIARGESVLCTFGFCLLVEPDPSAGALGSEDYINMTAYIRQQLQQALDSGDYVGPQGEQGEKGDPGEKGADGKSAYETAREAGYTGTEAEFAAKLAEEAPTVYEMTVTESGGVCTPSATAAQIAEAYRAGYAVHCVYNGIQLPLVSLFTENMSMAVFSAVLEKGVTSVVVDRDTASVQAYDLTTARVLPNPYALTLTGAVSATYTGASAVTVDIPTIAGEKGEKGDKGDPGEQGPQGEQGEKGDRGDPGADGQDGADGADGKDGADGYTPVRGTDYWTAADKAQMVSDVLEALTASEEVAF